MLGVCGCAGNSADVANHTEAEGVLNKRQESILSKQGLPTNFNELTASQQNAIVAIEDMLQYVENKYDTSFSYAGYSPEGYMEKEHMRAYPSDGDMQTDSFTISKTETGYTDDYIHVAINTDFSSYICENVQPFALGAEVKVYSEITETLLREVPSDMWEFDGNVESSIWIFIDGATYEEKEFPIFKMFFNDMMEKHSLYGTAQIILLKEGKLQYLTEYNYTDYLSEEHYSNRETVYMK